MSITNIYTSIACNPTTESADWGRNGLILYAANHAVVLYDPKYKNYSAKILQTYVHHTKRVNFVCWLQPFVSNNNDGYYFLTGSDDCLAILWWIKEPQQYNNPITYEMKGHQSGVKAAAGLQLYNKHWIFATASSDSSIKIWSYDNQIISSITCKQTLHNVSFCFTLKLTLLPKTDVVMLAFSDDERIQLWAKNDSEFQFVYKLLGHEDWVRGLDFVIMDDVDLILATCSQDNFIRLWRISPHNTQQVKNDNYFDTFNILNENSGEIKMEKKIIQPCDNLWYTISLESALHGHEGWVYSVQWHKSEKDLSLLSASIDKTLIIWQPVKDEGNIWMEKVRLGEVGGNSLGFFGAKFSNDGQSILGHSYHGGLHIWKYKNENNSSIWLPQVIVSGHFNKVCDLGWESQGEYLMSVSTDQTTRIHAPWRKLNTDIAISGEEIEQWTWHELTRPQVHGYDIQALAILTRYKFVSGAEEKIVRAFQAPVNFIENFRNIAKIQYDTEGDELLKNLPKGASVPSLGLSNKAVYQNERLGDLDNKTHHLNEEYPENYFVAIEMDTPPQEETLMQNTLWPEVQKLYGHGYEIYALASSPSGRLIASSCKSTNAEYAQIILWSTSNWRQIQKLSGHQLTVTQMRFSPNEKYLLSVSRDRCWSLFELQQQEEENDTSLINYKLTANTDKTNGIHNRIIWSCDWSHDSIYFVTSSRDGKVVIWTKNTETEAESLKSSLNGWKEKSTLKLKMESITAVAFAPTCHSNKSYVVALGCETGFIFIYLFDGNWSNIVTLDKAQAHHMNVRRLQYRPRKFNSKDYYELASCGEDHLVKIYGIQL